MLASRTLWLGAAALAALACSTLDAPAPAPRSVDPASGHVGRRTPVVIRGEGFAVRTTRSSSGGAPGADLTHRAWLGSTELEEVTWVDPQTLRAVVPAGLPEGRLPLLVENAFGLQGRLDDAFEAVAEGGASLVATLEAGAAIVSVGQQFEVAVQVTNTGATAAADLAAALVIVPAAGAAVSLVGPSPPSAASLAPGDAVTFTWTCVPTAAGAISLSASASARDLLSGEGIESPPAAAGVTIEVPAGLVATIAADRASATTGQAVAVTFTVTNGGVAGAEIGAVTPSFSPGLATSCTAPSPPPPRTIAHGESVPFAWVCTSASPGLLTLGGAVLGADLNSGEPISAAPATAATVAVQSPPALTTTLTASVTTANVGEAIAASLTIENGGGATADVSTVTPGLVPASIGSCSAASPAPPRPVAGGSSATFTWWCSGRTPGSAALAVALAATDANTGAQTPVSAADVPVVLEEPAGEVSELSATLAVGRSVANVGQAVPVTAWVTNTGASPGTVTGVVPSASGVPATCSAPTPAPPAALAVGEVATFAWACTPAGAGTMTLGAAVSGTAASGEDTFAAAAPAPVAVQLPAALAATALVATPTTAQVGEPIGVVLALSNVGGARATVAAVAPSASPSAGVTCTPAAPAPPQDIPPGETVSFAWACTASTERSPTLRATVTATDANDGATLSASVTGAKVSWVAVLPSAAASP